jgi:hypothetical protein
MILCSDEECAVCGLPPRSANCLRKQAERYMRMSYEDLSRGMRHAFEQLSLVLMEEAQAIEEETAIPPAL